MVLDDACGTAVILSAHSGARIAVGAALASRFNCLEALDVPGALAHIAQQPADEVAVSPPLVVLHTRSAQEGHSLVAALRRANAPSSFPILLLLETQEPYTPPAPEATPDDVVYGEIQPGLVALRARMLARVTAAEERIRRLQRYVPAPLFGSVMATGMPRPVERRWMSVLFGDIRGFTDATDFCQTEETIEVLNEYFAAAATTVAQHGGSIDKFMGDGVVAYFGADGGPNNALTAVRTALDLQMAIEALRVSWFQRGVLPVGIGLGVATGWVILGTIGETTRADFTVIGSVVNLAARLQGLARGGQIIVCAETQKRVRHAVITDEGRDAKIKGFDRPVRVHAILGRH